MRLFVFLAVGLLAGCMSSDTTPDEPSAFALREAAFDADAERFMEEGFVVESREVLNDVGYATHSGTIIVNIYPTNDYLLAGDLELATDFRPDQFQITGVAENWVSSTGQEFDGGAAVRNGRISPVFGIESGILFDLDGGLSDDGDFIRLDLVGGGLVWVDGIGSTTPLGTGGQVIGEVTINGERIEIYDGAFVTMVD